MPPLLLPALLVLGLAACARLPVEPVPGAPPHHAVGGFRNPWPGYERPDAWTRISFVSRRLVSSALSPRRYEAPRAEPAARGPADGGDSRPAVTWVGHATLLLQLEGVNVLTDPQWSDRASPLGWAGPRRLSPPGIPFEALPPIHAVVISHDHYDHLDRATVERLAARHAPLFVVPLGLAAWFRDRGIDRVVELDWWQAHEHRGLRFVCTPTQHFSQRTPWDQNRRLWASWAIVGATRRFYFSGDTGYFPGLREIGERLGPFDLAALAIGAYAPPRMMRPHHTDPEEAVQAFADLRGRVLLGMHWGTFDMTDEPFDEPPRRMRAETARRGIPPERAWVLALGEVRRW